MNLVIERQGSLSIPGSFELRDDECELSKSLHTFWEIESMGIQEKKGDKSDFLEEVQFNEKEIPVLNSYLGKLVVLQNRTDILCVSNVTFSLV